MARIAKGKPRKKSMRQVAADGGGGEVDSIDDTHTAASAVPISNDPWIMEVARPTHC